jgi:O-antigen ligase
VPTAIGALLACFVTLNLLSMMEAVDETAAVRFFGITLYVVVFAVWFAGYVDSERRARTVVLLYVAGASASALVGVAALFAPLPGRTLFLGGGDLRVEALLEDPNVFGPFLIPALLLLLEETLAPRLLRMPRAVKLLLLVLLSLGVLFSYSRGAWMNLGVSLLAMLSILALRRTGGARAATALTLVVVAVAATGVVVAMSNSFGFLSERAAPQYYDVERFSAQREGLGLAMSYPLGIGPGQFEGVVSIAAHSTYVRAVSEQGLLGLLAVLGVMVGTLVYAARNAIRGSDTYGIGSAALFGAWCGILANSFFIDTLHWRHLWLVAGLIWIGATMRKGTHTAKALNRARSNRG